MLNYFNFKKWNNDKILITNDFGKYDFLDIDTFFRFINNKIDENDSIYNELHERLFLLNDKDIYSEEILNTMRTSKDYLFTSTSLHIFVVTNMCNMKCIYCQAQHQNTIKKGNMTEDTAYRAIDIALQSPSPYLTFEFQGGEPLINYPVIKKMIEYAEKNKLNKIIDYTLVSNLSLITDEMIEFFKEYKVNICTSLDGDRYIHEHNRPMLSSNSSYDMMKKGLNTLKKFGVGLSAIETTTRKSFTHVDQILEEYLKLGFRSIFIRPLTPLGFAYTEWNKIGYSAEEYVLFYKEMLEKILIINKNGIKFIEQYAKIFLRRILKGESGNYMELRSPCGAVLGQLAYYYDGDIYTCDEARMISESGDKIFKLGNVYNNTYNDLLKNATCKSICAASILESTPVCVDCVYNPYCGVCPVINYAISDNIFTSDSKNYRCKIYKGIMDILFKKIEKNDIEEMKILYSWIED